jgi:hypothetical protein
MSLHKVRLMIVWGEIYESMRMFFGSTYSYGQLCQPRVSAGDENPLVRARGLFYHHAQRQSVID